MVRAGLERHVERAASRALAGLAQRDRFGVRFAVGAVPAAPDHLARGVGDHRAHHRVGRGAVAAARGQPQRRAQVGLVHQRDTTLRSSSS